MSLIEVLLIAVGVSMDAFAVSVAKGISASRITLKHALIAGLWFGGFQASYTQLQTLLVLNTDVNIFMQIE